MKPTYGLGGASVAVLASVLGWSFTLASATGCDDGAGGGGSDGGAGDTGSGSGATSGSGASSGDGGTSSGDGGTGGGTDIDNPLTNPEDGPPAGWSEGDCAVPDEAGLEDVSNPTTVVGTGTPESCTAQAFVDAVAAGGVIVFDCGDDPHTITLTEEAKVYNAASEQVVIDGGGLITLSGGGTTRILYMRTCDDALGITTPMCQNQEFPQLTLQNLTFIDASTEDMPLEVDGVQNEFAGGTAVYASGGRFKAVNTRWFNNRGLATGQDLGGTLRVMQQYNQLPAYIVNSTFGGAEGFGNAASNGGGISSISVNWKIYNSLFSYNAATGEGGNPAQPDTDGGGSGGAIYNDGADLTLDICGSLLENNTVNSFGEAIFFVANNMVGTVNISSSIIRNNCGGSWEPFYPSISNHDATPVNVTDSTITDCGQ